MPQLQKIFAVTAAVVPVTAFVLGVSMLSTSVHAQSYPSCSSASVDQDNDGYGWENNRTCLVDGSSGAGSTVQSNSLSGVPICSSGVSDPDFDGWGWENNASCVVAGSATATSSQSGTASNPDNMQTFPICSSSVVNPSFNGWGWENNATCVVAGSAAAASVGTATQTNNAASASTSTPATTADGVPVCQSSASDENRDGWGFENGVSCRVTAATSATESTATSVATPGVAPAPVAAVAPGFRDGHPICLTDSSDAGNNGFGYENDRTCVVAPGVTATRSQPLLNQRSCIPWLEIGYGNYKLQNNVWNFGAVYQNNWSQCIELTGGPGNYVAKWDYNWLQRRQGDEFAVKSYPQVYIGRKTQYNLSGSVAETGMPVPVSRMPQFWVDYDYSETGIVERNVALESFIHNSCEAEEHNKQFEMMVWVGKPTIRTPGTQVGNVTLSGRDWEVYTNPSLGWAYVAFVAVQPHTSGRLNWNEFINWSRDVGPSIGVPGMNRNGCMGAIEIGTETFWGTGTFTLNRFSVNGR